MYGRIIIIFLSKSVELAPLLDKNLIQLASALNFGLPSVCMFQVCDIKSPNWCFPVELFFVHFRPLCSCRTYWEMFTGFRANIYLLSTLTQRSSDWNHYIHKEFLGQLNFRFVLLCFTWVVLLSFWIKTQKTKSVQPTVSYHYHHHFMHIPESFNLNRRPPWTLLTRKIPYRPHY